MELTATFQVVTPMFSGGADPKTVEGYRLAGVKAQLRFWWRALHYPKLYRDQMHQPGFPAADLRTHALKALRQQEARLFGSTDGQAGFLMRLIAPRDRPHIQTGDILKDAAGNPVGPGARYLGYGLMTAYSSRNGPKEGTVQRACILPEQAFTISLRMKPRAEGFDGLRRAVIAFGLLGGLGSRIRRGYGSVSLIALEGGLPWQPPKTAEAYRDALTAVLPTDLSAAEASPPFTAFGPKTRLEILATRSDPLAALDHLGRRMQRHRSWGHRGQVNGTPSERNFPDDHDWAEEPNSPTFRSVVPRRIVYGLPQNYSKVLGVKPLAPRDRRASPLLLHVHALADGRFAAVATLMPSDFLPGTNPEVEVTTGNPKHRPANIDWSVLDEFFDGPPKRAAVNATVPYFPKAGRVMVLP